VISICYTVDAAFLGGAEHYVSRLAGALDRARFAPSVLVAAAGDAALDAWGVGLEREGIAVQRVPMRLPHRPWDALAIIRAFDAVAADIVHVNMPGPYSGQTGLLVPLARMAGARVVTTEHLPMVARLWKRALVKRFAYRWVDRAVTVSQANLPYLVEQGVDRSRTRVIYNGVAPDVPMSAPERARTRGTLGVSDTETLVVFVGNLLLHKGLCDTIEALSMLGSRTWRLLVVGAGPLEAEALGLVERLGVEDRVDFAGRRSPADVRALLRGVDVLALPSRIEGFPYAILEAMAAGVAVVATRVYGIPEAVDDGVTGALVDPGDIGALSIALGALIDDHDLRTRMGTAARRRFEQRFTLDRHVREMEALYCDLVGVAPPGVR
jgi:glycosyltransferase involved in cell wall biosynthesis